MDIAPGMLRAARNYADASGLSNVALHDAIPEQTFEWVNSFIVLQHVPPARGFPILHKLISVAQRYISIQLPFYRMGAGVPAIVRFDGETVDVVDGVESPQGTMNMYDYDINKVVSAFFERGFAKVHLVRTDHGGHVGGWVRAARF